MQCEQKPLVCDVQGCDKAFTRSSSLAVHKRIHSGEKRYVCKVQGCGKAFTQSGHLVSHQRTHDGVKTFVCDVKGCGKAFTHSGSLAVHKRTHSSLRPYVCDVDSCGKAFTQSGHLAVHRQSHDGTKPSVCEVEGCGKAFTHAGNLAVHMRTHTGMRPYACNVEWCGQAFPQATHLAKHMRTHTPEGMQRRKRQEQRVAAVLDAAGISYKREHQVNFDCIRADQGKKCARADFLILLGGRVVLLEVDELQHMSDGYTLSCEMRRTVDIMSALLAGGNELPLVMIRYNPDAYSVDGRRVKRPRKEREDVLLRVLAELAALREPGEPAPPPFQMLYMYYDSHRDAEGEAVPCILEDPEYSQQLRECCMPAIV
jgi:hypothetical protein